MDGRRQNRPRANFQDDVKGVGSIVALLADRQSLMGEEGSRIKNLDVSESLRSFVGHSQEQSVESLLRLSTPGGGWSLKRHYFKTLPLGVRIGSYVGASDG
ncbi:hypothetical protein N7532_001393 [Penicillium argentinense]|uniref:Uncharacterized protein n=1 Tax=Penicillium argentinense TaxID=1131581 RepID=A0A9W9G2H8_9EURO|nr:uncharacterized protein N7532_001393 [Penicillium argentinense]KAJ5110858.1 hypothetical protein N7532_001393 [Penicillium argentinense]